MVIVQPFKVHSWSQFSFKWSHCLVPLEDGMPWAMHPKKEPGNGKGRDFLLSEDVGVTLTTHPLYMWSFRIREDGANWLLVSLKSRVILKHSLKPAIVEVSHIYFTKVTCSYLCWNHRELVAGVP